MVAPLEQRVERVQARSKISRDKVERRVAAQIDPDAARKLADYVIENDGSFDRLDEQVRTVYGKLAEA